MTAHMSKLFPLLCACTLRSATIIHCARLSFRTMSDKLNDWVTMPQQVDLVRRFTTSAYCVSQFPSSSNVEQLHLTLSWCIPQSSRDTDAVHFTSQSQLRQPHADSLKCCARMCCHSSLQMIDMLMRPHLICSLLREIALRARDRPVDRTITTFGDYEASVWNIVFLHVHPSQHKHQKVCGWGADTAWRSGPGWSVGFATMGSMHTLKMMGDNARRKHLLFRKF